MMALRRILAGLVLACIALPGLAKDEAKLLKIGGIDVILRTTTANEVVAAELFIKGGTTAVPENMSVSIEGMALGVAAESGSMKYSKDEYQRKLAGMVSTIGGAGMNDYSTFSMRCVREHFKDTWAMFADVITSPRFDSIEVMKMKRNTITGIKSIRSNPDAFVGYLADSLYFQGHPYSRRPTIENVNAITENDLQAHFKNLFVKSRLLLVVVGNVSEDDLRAGIESSFASLPVGNFTTPILPEVNRPAAAVVVDKKLPTTYILGYYAAPGRMAPDYWPMVMATSALSDRLFEEVRTKRNLSYAPSAGLRPNKTSVGILYVSTTLPDSAVRVIFNTIQELKSVPMTEKQVKSQLAQFLTTVYLRDETNASQAEALGRYQLLTGSWENSLHVVEKVQQVTATDIQNAATKYMHGYNFAAVGKAEHIDKALLESK